MSDWSSDVCSSDLKKPEPFRASQESRSSQDGRLFYVLVFRDHSPDRDSTGLSISHAVRSHEEGGERRNGQRRPAWPGADRCFVNERALAERRMAHTPAHWIRTIVAFRRRSGSGVPRCTVATDLRREKPIHSAGIGSASACGSRAKASTLSTCSISRDPTSIFISRNLRPVTSTRPSKLDTKLL